MLVIGIVGGIASGKSVVAQCLAQLGAEVLDADRVGHEVLKQPEVLEAIRHRWGEGVLLPSGEANRPAIAKLVFNREDNEHKELRFLEKVTHPRIGALLETRIAELRHNSQIPALVLDAPVMFEAKWNAHCDFVLFVDVPLALRQKRAREQRGWSDDEFAARESAQWSVESKRRQADFVIDNSGSVESTCEQVHAWWKRTCEQKELYN